MKLYKMKTIMVCIIFMYGMSGISGCTFLKEKFLSDITKNTCEKENWSSVGAIALDLGKNPDAFNYYKVQCKKYFDIDVPDTRFESFLDGYDSQKVYYCTPEKAESVGAYCGYYNVQACFDIVSSETLMNLFDSFQNGNVKCKDRMFADGMSSCVCLCTCQ